MAKVKIKAQDEPSADYLDGMPLIKRRRLLLSDKPPSSSSGAPPERPVGIAAKRLPPGVLREWQGLPKGVKFDPSDEELLWHLLAKVGKGEAEPHPLISEFIISLDEDDGFGYFHPQNLPGLKQDGSVSYFFHRTFKTINSGSRKHRKIHNGDFGDFRWHNIGKAKPVVIDGIHLGWKKMMSLYMGMKKGEKPEKTNWMMHQYHVGREEDEGEVVASKIFYQQKSRQNDKKAQVPPLESVEAVVTAGEVSISSTTVGSETHMENQPPGYISMEASDQALAYHESRGEETNTHAGCAKLDTHDNHPKEDSENGVIEHQVLLDSQHHVEGIIASGELCQTQSYNESKAERSKSCIFDGVLDISSRLSDNLKNQLNECIPGGVPDKLFPAEVCYEDSASETATVKLLSTSSSESPDSVIAGRPVTVDQSPNLDGQNTLEASYSLVNKKTDRILSYPKSISEIKSSVIGVQHGVVGVQHGCLIANSQPYSSGSSKFLVHVKAEPLEDEFVNGISDTDAAMQYRAGILGSPDKSFEESSFTDARYLSEARTSPETKESEETNCRYSNAAHISKSKLSFLGQTLANENDNSHLFDSVLPTFPIEVKAEPLEESHTKSTLETSSEILWTDNNQPFDSFLSTLPVELKVEPSEETYPHSVPESITGKFSSASLSGYIKENSSTITQCKANKFHDDVSSGGKNFQENVSTDCPFYHQPSLPKEAPLNSTASELSSTTVLGSLGRCSSDNSCTFTQFNENAGSCQDNISFTSSNLKKETGNICYDQSSFPEKVHIDATDKLQNSIVTNCEVMVKFEPLENESLTPCRSSPSSFQDISTLRDEVKGELLDELSDLIDHIPLIERIEMQLSGNVSNLDYGNNLKRSQQIALHTSRRGSVSSLNAEASRLSVRRKRKKTATDSVETALEEDIPGLLQVLLDKGITIEEIKLYGDMEDDDVALGISCPDDSFEDLETVIAKLFSERSSIFKLNLVRHTKGSNAVYCLSCLISLIEQTRYFQFRNIPVEWGWCRDLQSFIFVFERHNRIVLERPEYGYATYFFELVGSLPIDWQIKRLVTAMKLTNCSRTTLIENRSLLVGEDLTEGEARVLEDYGWTRNSGLGSLLNFCDRVVHDRRNERDSSYWRAKIGKQLMNGHDGGCTVVANPPKKVVEYMGGQCPSVKLEI